MEEQDLLFAKLLYLQNVVDETAGADINAMIAALTALKSQFVNGRVD